MPHRPPSPCLKPGCPNVCTTPYCEGHTEERRQQKRISIEKHDRTRPTARQRGYDRRWQRMAKQYLHDHPTCEYCWERKAKEVDHIIALRDGGAKYSAYNLKAACWPCHRCKTAEEKARRESTKS